MRKTLVVGAVVLAALGMASAPALAADKPSGRDRTSATTNGGVNLWNEGGRKAGEGAAKLVSGAFLAIPSYAVDIVGTVPTGKWDANPAR